MVKSVILYASELAACIGRNKFKSPHDALLQIWSRMSPESYAKYVSTCDIVMTSVAKDVMKMNPVSTDEIASLVARVKECEPCPNAVQSVKSALYTKFGTAHEDFVAQKLSSDMGIQIVKTNKFVKKLMFVDNDNGLQVYVGGRLDGMTGTDCVVEIKNRMNRLFNRVCDYEKLQISAYMHIMGVSNGIIVERHKNDIVVHKVEFDEDDWCEVVGLVRVFINDLTQLLNNEDRMRDFVCFIPDL